MRGKTRTADAVFCTKMKLRNFTQRRVYGSILRQFTPSDSSYNCYAISEISISSSSQDWILRRFSCLIRQ